MKYPGAIGPALRILGRVVRANWPVLLGLTLAYPLINWGAGLVWKAMPGATGWVATGLHGGQILLWAMAWGLLGAFLTQLTLATVDGRPSGPGALLRACASALPVVAVIVLITDVTSLPLSLWRTHLATSGQIGEAANWVGLLSLPFAILDTVAFWLLAMAVPVRLDQELPLAATMKASAGYGRRRWRTMLLLFFLIGAGSLVIGIAAATSAIASGLPTDGKPPSWMTDSYLWQVPLQVLSMTWMLFWPALYVTFRDQEGTDAVAETFA